ncbi:MAG: flagellar basal body L-ring protein FlgH [Planctomycetaceae bacterium]|nr:flagellar basal body L-ring protein FlgH [Planctomycetaceae bacterium]
MQMNRSLTSSLAILPILAMATLAHAVDGAATGAKPTANEGTATSAPAPATKSAPKRVLRDDERPAAVPTRSLVTIVISESSRSKSASDAKADKDYEMSAAVDAWISMDPTAFGDGFFTPIDSGDLPEIGVAGEKSFKGKGSYARSDDFTARVTAEIVEVRPNGLLVLEARREIVNDGESQIITLSGICRPEDIDANNQVISQRVADAVVKKITTGELRNTAEKGVLAKLIDTIFAF